MGPFSNRVFISCSITEPAGGPPRCTPGDLCRRSPMCCLSGQAHSGP